MDQSPHAQTNQAAICFRFQMSQLNIISCDKNHKISCMMLTIQSAFTMINNYN